MHAKTTIYLLCALLFISSCSPTKQASQLISAFENDNLQTKGGALLIWGTSFGKVGDNFYEIKDIRFDKTQKKLTLETNYVKVEIWNPKGIGEVLSQHENWPTSIQIKKASRVRLEYHFENIDYFADFDYESKKIESNSDLYKGSILEDPEKPALVII